MDNFYEDPDDRDEYDDEWYTWYDMFKGECKRLKYQGPIDKDSFRDEYNAGRTPEEAAKEFVKEMNE